ncbi:MAG: hypothetical protein HWN67_03920 [Candidatus Helarchaeota archaeon]|nr:hypothetical protein [Candidatus Helarchaeota archaeon]
MAEEEKTHESAMEEEKEWYEEEFPDKWWFQISWIRQKTETEPSGLMLFIDYMLDQAIITPEAVKIASLIPHRLVLIEIVHPKKKLIERLSFMISPTSVTPDIPDTEPDLIIRISYYDIAKFLLGKASFSESFFLGRGEIFGNVLALIDIADILEVAQGKKMDQAKEARPKIWPVGFP